MKVYNRKSESERKDCYKVAYAALSQKLTINGTAEVKSATWKIQLNNPQTTKVGTATVDGFTLSEDTTKIEGFKVTLKQPGDKVTLTVDAENKGSINAELLGVNGTINDISGNGKLVCDPDEDDGQTICGATGKNDGVVKYTVKYDNEDITNEGISTSGLTNEKKKLAAENGTKKIEITVEYDTSKTLTSETLPTQDVQITLPTISFDYGQDESV